MSFQLAKLQNFAQTHPIATAKKCAMPPENIFPKIIALPFPHCMRARQAVPQQWQQKQVFLAIFFGLHYRSRTACGQDRRRLNNGNKNKFFLPLSSACTIFARKYR